jgi:hypothetical protein
VHDLVITLKTVILIAVPNAVPEKRMLDVVDLSFGKTTMRKLKSCGVKEFVKKHMSDIIATLDDVSYLKTFKRIVV